MTIYDEIAEALLPVLEEFAVGGSSWHVYRASGDGIHTATRPTLEGEPRTLFVLRNAPDRQQRSQAGTPIATAAWLGYAALGTDIAVDDILVSVADSPRAFLVSGAVETDEGMVVAPLAPTRAP